MYIFVFPPETLVPFQGDKVSAFARARVLSRADDMAIDLVAGISLAALSAPAMALSITYTLSAEAGSRFSFKYFT